MIMIFPKRTKIMSILVKTRKEKQENSNFNGAHYGIFHFGHHQKTFDTTSSNNVNIKSFLHG